MIQCKRLSVDRYGSLTLYYRRVDGDLLHACYLYQVILVSLSTLVECGEFLELTS